MSQAPNENAPPPVEGATVSAPPGEVLPRKFGKYTLLRRLATGGMAELFLALHRSVAGFEKLVVIKRILPEMSKDQGFISMFLTEARVAATFSHPNIVTIFDVGQAEGSYFIAMEHIHGEDLRSVVRAMKPRSVTEFPLEHVIAIVLGVSAGLAYAHDKTDLNGNPLHVVHRDISPQNVLVTFSGDVKLVDFGIAKAARGGKAQADVVTGNKVSESTDDNEHQTKAGQLKGKVPYMSPEQARGEDLDARSDIFSLGVMFFELATGRRLFRGPNETETLKMITEGEYPRPSTVNPRISPALELIIMRALAKDRNERYQNGRELQGELEQLARFEQIPVSNLSLGNWMQMLFEERLAAQREALLQGKQLADVLAAEEPQEYTAAGTIGGSLASIAPPAPPSKVPWVLAAAGVTLVALVAGGAVAYREKKSREQEAALAAVNSGSINVRSTPAGAAIWINGAPTQYRTPYTLRNLATGPNARYAVRVTQEGMTPVSRDIRLPTQNAVAMVDANLERAIADALVVLEVNTTPRGARVLVDGNAATGTTPLTVSGLAPGVEHTVLIQHPDTTNETFRFTQRPGEVERRVIALTVRPLGPDEAWVNATVEPGSASLRVGDRTFNTGSPFRVRVQTGRVLNFVFGASGYESTARIVRARPGTTVDLPAIRLQRPSSSSPVDRRPGSLRVGATPWCNVTVDGRSLGQTPVDVSSISSGIHNVVCTNPTRGAQSQRVTVQPGQQAIARFRF